MKFNFPKAFFVPLVLVLTVLSLTSCGKDYDLVSEYVVRDGNTKSSINKMNDEDTFSVAVINDITTDSVKKK